jgi:transcriptional regulator with XRE-family HTH domain
MDDNTFIGTKLRSLREAKGLARLQLQRLTGLAQCTIERAEIAGVITRRTAERLAPVLGVRPEDLFGAGRP